MSVIEKLEAKFGNYKPPAIDPTYNFFVYGGTGTGKTTLVASLKEDAVASKKKVLLLNNDMGDKSILSSIYDVEPYQWLISETVEKYDDIRNVYRYLANGKHDFGWCVLDDTTNMADMLLTKLQQPDEYGDDAWGAYGALNSQFRSLLRAFRGLPMNILFLAREDKNKTPATAAFPGKALGDGNDGSSVLHEFDHAYRAIRIANAEEDDEFFLQTKATDDVEAKRRDEFNCLDFMEQPDISAIKAKLVESLNQNLKGGK